VINSSKACLELKLLFFACLVIVVININLSSIGILKSFVALVYSCLLTSFLCSSGAYQHSLLLFVGVCQGSLLRFIGYHQGSLLRFVNAHWCSLVFYWCSLALLNVLSMLFGVPWSFVGVCQCFLLWSISVHWHFNIFRYDLLVLVSVPC